MQAEGYASFPIRTMETNFNVPYIAPMLRLLESHGVTTQEIRDCTYVSDDGKQEGYKRFLITFPEGTRYVEGMLLFRAMPFKLRFPDGDHLPGVRFSGMFILYLPAEEVESG